MNREGTLYKVVLLGVLCAICGLLLGGVNAVTAPVIAEAKNVESPANAKHSVSGAILPIPWAMVMPAPMHRQVSTMSRGMAFPRV